MPAFQNPHITWRKSSLCDGGGCVEVAVVEDTSTDNAQGDDMKFLMRNSREPAGQILRLTSEEWTGFISYIKGGTGL
jgi:hypothetical protein